ncbi:hypothetical protein JHN52_01025 [Streptomyces sp. MBT97]|uniref:hypothetical protein n=1 Tax=Streptomyces sp. MBT97 TaxID=2800411 RepID=UPI00190C2D90|nr:hypothetical protein [Streptomyces sp. MBT97]MBK3631563.1 hypothetical protein [Streptomyces sp. MBT97]
MASIPRRFLIHTITVEDYLGDTSKGPRYRPARTVRCLVDEQTRGVRSPAGEQVTSTSTAYAGPEEQDVPQFSRVTLPSGRTTTVIQTKRRDGKGLGTPNHVEIQLE